MPPKFNQKKRICVGIDLGTSSSCCSYIDPTTKQLTVLSHGTNKSTIPSIVHYSPTNHEILVGDQAQQRGSSYPKSTIFGAKRLIGLTESSMDNKRVLKDLSYGPFDLGITSNGEIGFQITNSESKTSTIITPTNVATQILNYFKEQIERQTNNVISEVVLTVPAYFTPDQRSETAKAAQDAGLKVLRLIPEPTAAAFAYVQAARSSMVGQHLMDKEPDYILVYDFGGGTLDCSLVRQTYHGANNNKNDNNNNNTIFDPADSSLEVLATAGDPLLGGADLDNDLIKWCVKQLSTHFQVDASTFLDDPNKTRRLRQICKNAKESLSSALTIDLDLDDLYKREPFTLKLTRQLFQTICKETLKRAFNPIKQVLQDANIDKSKVKDVVLVGGSSRIPLIQDQLKKIFNFGDISQLSRIVNPDECVAKGAALFAATLTSVSEQKSNTMLATCVNSFPLTMFTSYGGIKSIIPLIKLNQSLPIKGSTDVHLDRAVLRNLDPPLLRVALFQVPIDDEPTNPPSSQWIEEQFNKLKPRMFKRWGIPIDGISNFGDMSPYTITIHYQIDENGIMDIFFQDQELNLIIDVSLNKNTTDTVVKEQLSTQNKVDVLTRYQTAQQEQQQQRLAIPPPPTAPLRNQSQQQQQQQQQIQIQQPIVPIPPIPSSLPELPTCSPPQVPVKTDVVVTPDVVEVTPSLPPQPQLPIPEQPTLPSPPQQQPPQPPQSQQESQTQATKHLAPPPIPAHLNQKLINQLKDLVQVRDDMIMQLQEQIFQLKHQLEQRDVQWNNTINEYEHQRIVHEGEIIDLKNQLFTAKATPSTPQTQSPPSELNNLLEPDVDMDNKIAIATAEISERLVVMEGQYTTLYSYYDDVVLESQQKTVQLEQTALDLRDTTSKLEHANIVVERLNNVQGKLEVRVSQLEKELEEVNQTNDNLRTEIDTLKSSSSSPLTTTSLQPPTITRQVSSKVLFTEDEQSDMVLTSMPPLPPIAPSIFTPPTQQKHPAPPPFLAQLRVRSTAAPQPLNIAPLTPQQSSSLQSSTSKLPPLPTSPFPSTSSSLSQSQSQQPQHDIPHAPQAPEIPSDYHSSYVPEPQQSTKQSNGGSGRAFLADIMSRPQLKKVNDTSTSTSSGSSSSSLSSSSSSSSSSTTTTSGDDNNEAPVPPPRVSLLTAQLQQASKGLKSVKKSADGTPITTNNNIGDNTDSAQAGHKGLLTGEIMDKINKFRAQVAADDDEEEDDDFEGW